MNETLFTKIGRGEIPSVKIYEDDICFVILDLNPVNKGHALVIARESWPNVGSCPDEVLSHMIKVAKRTDSRLREVLGCNGTNILINNDPASGQEIPHLHIHVVPRYFNDGKALIASDKKERYADGEMAEYGERLKFSN